MNKQADSPLAKATLAGKPDEVTKLLDDGADKGADPEAPGGAPKVSPQDLARELR